MKLLCTNSSYQRKKIRMGIGCDWWVVVLCRLPLRALVLFLVSLAGLSCPDFLCFFVDVAPNPRILCIRIGDFSTATACVLSHVFLCILSSSQDKMHCTPSLTVCTCTPCQRASFNSTTDSFFRGVMTVHSCLWGQAFIWQMWDLCECVIVIVLLVKPVLGITLPVWVPSSCDVILIICCCVE